MKRRRRPSSVHGVLVVNKPRGPTSHDVVAVARRAFDTSAVGHAGTLDPMATGVLVLALGEATKLVSYLTAADKEYVAELTLGEETDTLDADGVVVRTAEVPKLELDDVQKAAASFVGKVRQTPPRVSAIKVDGRPLHVRVRRGEDVTAPERDVVVHALDVLELRGAVIRFRVACEKGFYVRSLGRDLAAALGTVGHLTALERVRSGSWRLSRAVSFDELKTACEDDAVRARLLAAVVPLASAWEGRRLVVDSAGARDAGHGKKVAVASTIAPGADSGEALREGEVVALIDESGALVALAAPDGEGRLEVVRGFVR
jgi:tRNA pseudouridine55 synthase